MRPFPVVPAFGVYHAAVGEGHEEFPRGVGDGDEVVGEEGDLLVNGGGGDGGDGGCHFEGWRDWVGLDEWGRGRGS